ncbi:hypothetical protein GCM10028862_06220 [Luteimonas pelagia]
MLIGFGLSDLGWRSKLLLALAFVLLGVALGVQWIAPEPPLRVMRLFLLAIVALGAYWLSFLADAGPRLGRVQAAVAAAMGLLPWILVLALLFAWPELVTGG